MSLFCHYFPKTRTRSQFWVIPVLLLIFGLVPQKVIANEISINQNTYQIEIASNIEQRRLGLMHRESLAGNQGLLLMYPVNGDHKIWMKNMLIPLTLVWINQESEVVEVKQVQPCTKNPCTVYSSSQLSRYVLELNEGPHPVKIGDRVMGLQELTP